MHYFSSSIYMPIFILVRQLVLLVCINSALIMSPPAQTINKTPLNHFPIVTFPLCHTEFFQGFPYFYEGNVLFPLCTSQFTAPNAPPRD